MKNFIESTSILAKKICIDEFYSAKGFAIGNIFTSKTNEMEVELVANSSWLGFVIVKLFDNTTGELLKRYQIELNVKLDVFLNVTKGHEYVFEYYIDADQLVHVTNKIYSIYRNQ